MALPENVETLPDDPKLLKEILLQILTELRDQRNRNAQLEQQYQQLKRMHFGPRSEKVVVGEQGLLPFVQYLTPAPPPPAAPAPAAGSKPEAKPNGHGRSRLPAHLPREKIVLERPAAERICPKCGKEMTAIGHDHVELIEYTPPRFVVKEVARSKYACKEGCEVVATAEVPPEIQPLPKGMAGPAILAHVTVSKYADHLPLNRQQVIFRRQGIELARSTLADWIKDVVWLITPVVEAMKQEILASGYINTDDTIVPVLDETRRHAKQGRLWVYVGRRPRWHAVFVYSPTREKKYAEDVLRGVRGKVQADAYPGYNLLFQSGLLLEIGCWAHARRGFFEAKETDPERALAALGFVQQLYAVEDEAKDKLPEERLRLRQEKAKLVLDQFDPWLNDVGLQVLPKSPMGEAIGYVQRQSEALRRYLEDPMLDIDNNIAERTLRCVAVGRKNWMFAGSDAGGHRAAAIYSLIESCKLNRIDPMAYLKDVLPRVARHPGARAIEFAPAYWKPPGPGP
jgi:transposase